MARTIHRGLSHLFGGLLVIQFFLAGLGTFMADDNGNYKDSYFNPHIFVGTIMVALSLVILLVVLAGRVGGDARRLSAVLFGLMVLQFVLAGLGAGTAAWVGGLHAVNAVLITGATFLLIRDAREPEPVAA
jgi:Family of unknown function (DUF6220)